MASYALSRFLVVRRVSKRGLFIALDSSLERRDAFAGIDEVYKSQRAYRSWTVATCFELAYYGGGCVKLVLLCEIHKTFGADHDLVVGRLIHPPGTA